MRNTTLSSLSFKFLTAIAIIAVALGWLPVQPAYALTASSNPTSCTTGSPGWTNPANAVSSNNLRATSTANKRDLNCSFSITIPAGSTINGIEILPEGSTSGTRQANVSISWNNGTNFSTAPLTTFNGTEAPLTLGGSSDTWGHIWTVTELTTIVVRLSSDNGSNTLSIDNIVVRVTYTNNTAPTDITLSASSLAENNAINAVIGTLSATDPDAGETFSFSLACAAPGADNASFNISGTSLRASSSFDFETKNSYSICVHVTDSGSNTFDKNFTITVTNVNEAPTDISLSSSNIVELSPGGFTSTISATDPDAGETFTFSLACTTAGVDDSSFIIFSDILQSSAFVNFEAQSSYSICIRVTDSANNTFDKNFTITVIDSNEAPTDISLTDSIIPENNTINDVIGILSATDPDTGDTFTFALSCTTAGTDDASFNINGTNLRASSVFDYETKSSYGICIRVTDQSGTGLTFDKNFTITIGNVNETPVVTTSGGTTAFTEGIPVVIDGGLTVVDGDSNTLASATVSITGNFQSSQDILVFVNTPNITASYATGVLTLTGIDTAANYQAALRSVEYQNTSDIPNTANRLISFVVNDGSLDSNVATKTISLTTVDDDPIAVDDNVTWIDEDSGATTIDVRVTDIDVDGGTKDIIAVTQPVNGTVVNNTIDLSYQPNPNYCNNPPGITQDIFTYTLNGGSTATVTVTVNCVDDIPGAANDSATVNEDAAATAIDVLANDMDIDGGPKSIVSVTLPANGTVAITGGGIGLSYQPDPNYCNDGNPTDEFRYTLNGGSTATVAVTVTCADDNPVAVNDTATVNEDAAAATIDVLANDTNIDGGPINIVSVTQPANGTVVNNTTDLTYQPDPNYCNDGVIADDFTYTLNGGSTATVSVTVDCVNDAPVNTVPGAQSVNQDTNLIFSTGNSNLISISDIDAGGGNVEVTLTSSNGLITLSGTTGLSFTVGSGTGDATMTFRGSTTDINNALNGLIFSPTAGYTGSAAVQITTSDLGLAGAGGTQTDTDTVSITVLVVNSAPTDISLSSSSIAENDVINAVIGALSAVDPDAGETFTFTLACTVPAGDEGSFNINGANLRASSVFDFETKNSYSVCIRVTDSDSNTFDKNFTISITDVDEVAPDTGIDSSPSTSSNSTTATFAFSGTDSGSGIAGFECSLDSGPFTACTSPQTYMGLTSGNHTFEVRAIDNNGNVDPSPAAFTWVVDITVPTVVLSTTTTSPTSTSPISITITFSEPVTGFTPSFAAGDLLITNGTDSNASGSGATYTFNLTPSSPGAVTILVPAGSAQDAASNPNTVSNTLTIVYDPSIPTVSASSPANSASISTGLTQLTVMFSEDVKNDGSAGAANNITNYLLLEDGANSAFDTLTCAGGVVTDDTAVGISAATYTNNGSSGPFVTTLTTSPLAAGSYRLYVCGTTSIQDLNGTELNGGVSDAQVNFTVTAPTSGGGGTRGGGSTAAVTLTNTLLPATGFPMNQVTSLPVQPADKVYSTTDMWLEIPKLNVKMSIVGVPTTEGQWNVTWLDKDAGWLNGSAYPTWKGNSVITGHVWDALNKPGPFAKLKDLKYGDQIKIHAFGSVYVYEIRSTESISPSNSTKVFKHEEKSWLTLITCEDYKELTNSYLSRRMLKAVLISVSAEQ